MPSECAVSTAARISSLVMSCWRGSSPVDAMPPDGIILIKLAPRPRCSRTRMRACSGESTRPPSLPGCESAGSRPFFGSPCPPVGPSGSNETQRRGPGILPSLMAFRTETVSPPPPTSRALVKPCCSIWRTNTVASSARSVSVCVTQYSVALVRLGNSCEICTWQSMNPGITVELDRSMISAPAGVTNPDSKERILSSCMRMDTRCRGASATFVDEGAGVDDDILRIALGRS